MGCSKTRSEETYCVKTNKEPVRKVYRRESTSDIEEYTRLRCLSPVNYHEKKTNQKKLEQTSTMDQLTEAMATMTKQMIQQQQQMAQQMVQQQVENQHLL